MKSSNMQLILVFSICTIFISESHLLISSKVLPKCQVRINGQLIQKTVGDIWNSSNDVCTKHTCEIDAAGAAVEKTFREYCIQKCHNQFQLVKRKNQCCGECVATKCSHNRKLYAIGAIWKSDDHCTYFECTQVDKGHPDDGVKVAEISKYSKACPALGECPSNRITMRDCCQVCAVQPQANDESAKLNFVHPVEKYKVAFAHGTYRNHPCNRQCRQGRPSLTCFYKFIVEWYTTLGNACGNCPIIERDCHQPECIYADGVRRTVVVVNRMLPGPSIEVCQGDTIVIDVENHLLGEGITVHWHGLRQQGTPHFDGVAQVTQCAIPSHTSFRYNMTASDAGTHWWHSHVGMQRADGAFGALIVREPVDNVPTATNLYDYDESEHVLLIHDWYRDVGVADFSPFHHRAVGKRQTATLLINGHGRHFEVKQESTSSNPTSPANMAGTKKVESSDTETAENPLEDTTSSTQLQSSVDGTKTSNPDETPSDTSSRRERSIQENGDAEASMPIHHNHEVIHVKLGFKYRMRIINSGSLNCPIEISVDNHNITIIASDGHYFQPLEVQSLATYAGERYDFVVHANQPIGNYWLRAKSHVACKNRYPTAAILRYRGAAESSPNAELTSTYHRDGIQLNSLRNNTNAMRHISLVDVKSTETDAPELVKENADYKFFVYFDNNIDATTLGNATVLAKQKQVVNQRTETATTFDEPLLNHISMKLPPRPLLIARNQNDEATFCNASSLAAYHINCHTEQCECIHVIRVPLNATVELILVDETRPMVDGSSQSHHQHPFHLHGYDFRVVGMERVKTTIGITVDEFRKLDEAGNIPRTLKGAVIKDTVGVPSSGYTILRFLANNAGFWTLQSDIEQSMQLVFKVGDYEQMTPLPTNFPTCNNYNSDDRVLSSSNANSLLNQTHLITGTIGISILIAIVLQFV